MNLEYLFDDDSRVIKLIQGAIVSTVTEDTTPSNMLLADVNPDFECPQNSSCYQETEPKEASVYIVLNDETHFADQIELIYNSYIKYLIGRQEEFFDFVIFWKGQMITADSFTPRYLVKRLKFDEEFQSNRFDTINLMIKSYMRICNNDKQGQLIIIHDTEDNSEDILEKLNQSGLIGSTVYLFAQAQDEEDDSHSHYNYSNTGDDNSQVNVDSKGGRSDYTSSSYDYNDDYDGYKRKRRSAVGTQAIRDWNLENKRIPLLKSLCQILEQSEKVIETECSKLEQPEVIIADKPLTDAKKALKGPAVKYVGCSIHVNLTVCTEVAKEIIFVVEIPSEGGLSAMLMNINAVVSKLENSRFSLFLNNLLVLVSLDNTNFEIQVQNLLKMSHVNQCGDIDWNRLNSNIDRIITGQFDIDANNKQCNAVDDAVDDYDESKDVEVDYSDHYESDNDDYNQNDSDGSDYASNYRRRRSSDSISVIGAENITNLESRKIEIVLLPATGGQAPTDPFTDKVNVIAFELGAKFKDMVDTHIFLDVSSKFPCEFIDMFCIPQPDPLPVITSDLNCFANIGKMDYGTGSICRTTVDNDINRQIELLYLIEITESTNIKSQLDEIATMLVKYNNGVDAFRVSIFFNNILVALSQSEEDLELNFETRSGGFWV